MLACAAGWRWCCAAWARGAAAVRRAEGARGPLQTAPEAIVVVSPALGELGGEASVVPCVSSAGWGGGARADELQPRWSARDSSTGASVRVHSSADGWRARRLRRGVRYRVVLSSPGEPRAPPGAVFEVREARFPTVVRYSTVGASEDGAHDGEVHAEVRGCAGGAPTLAWSNGAFTRGASLRGVPPGVYFGLVVDLDGERVPCLHAAAPAVLGLRVADAAAE